MLGTTWIATNLQCWEILRSQNPATENWVQNARDYTYGIGYRTDVFRANDYSRRCGDKPGRSAWYWLSQFAHCSITVQWKISVTPSSLTIGRVKTNHNYSAVTLRSSLPHRVWFLTAHPTVKELHILRLLAKPIPSAEWQNKGNSHYLTAVFG